MAPVSSRVAGLALAWAILAQPKSSNVCGWLLFQDWVPLIGAVFANSAACVKKKKNRCHLCHPPSFSVPLPGEGQTACGRSGNRLQTPVDHSKTTGLDFSSLSESVFNDSGVFVVVVVVVVAAEGGEVIKSDPALWEPTRKKKNANKDGPSQRLRSLTRARVPPAEMRS